MPIAILPRNAAGELLTYFDRTAVEAWSRLTSDAPVGRIRATVRAGRDEMRNTLLSWLPQDLRGLRAARCRLRHRRARDRGGAARRQRRRDRPVADAGRLARERIPSDLGCGSIEFRVGDMTRPEPRPLRPRGRDGLADPLRGRRHGAGIARAGRARRRLACCSRSPRGPRRWPSCTRSAACSRAAIARRRSSRWRRRHCARLLAADADLARWRAGRSDRVASGFYTSQALELRRA